MQRGNASDNSWSRSSRSKANLNSVKGMTRSLKWKIIWHAFYVILAMWYTLRVSISYIDRYLTIFISKVAMIRESLLDFILTEKVNYFALFFIFCLPELSIFVIYRNFGWTSNYKCFPFKEYGRNINLYSKKRRGILISIYMWSIHKLCKWFWRVLKVRSSFL